MVPSAEPELACELAHRPSHLVQGSQRHVRFSRLHVGLLRRRCLGTHSLAGGPPLISTPAVPALLRDLSRFRDQSCSHFAITYSMSSGRRSASLVGPLADDLNAVRARAGPDRRGGEGDPGRESTSLQVALQVAP